MNKTKLIIGALVIGCIAFYNMFLGEYLDYKTAIEDRTEEAFDNYLWNHYDGRYREEVRFVQLETTQKIDDVRSFIKDYPTSEYWEKAVAIKNDLWNAEIENYERKVKEQNGNPEAVKFFRQLLTYMKDNNVYDIHLKFKSNVSLNNYEDYSPEAKALLESDADPTIEGNMIPLKPNFAQGSISRLEAIVEQGIDNSMDSVFSPGFVDVNTTADHSDLSIIIEYNIKNQEFDYEGITIPDLWTYSEGDVFSSYLLGISIDFKFDFHIPESDQTYSFTERANPGAAINGVEDIRDGYKRMTQMTFALFANTISTNFGLDAGYQ